MPLFALPSQVQHAFPPQHRLISIVMPPTGQSFVSEQVPPLAMHDRVEKSKRQSGNLEVLLKIVTIQSC